MLLQQNTTKDSVISEQIIPISAFGTIRKEIWWQNWRRRAENTVSDWGFIIPTVWTGTKNTAAEHLLSFYKTYDDVKDENFDGLIITGAPVEKLEFEEVEYWDELCAVMEWSKTHVTSTFHICWGAQAGLYYHYGIKKRPLPEKLSGVYLHTKERKNSILLRGFDDNFYAPHSRNTTCLREDIEACPELKILAAGEKAGVYAVSNHGGSQIFIMGHSEYDPDTLKKEYLRDKAAGLDPKIPENYFPGDDDTKAPIVTWRGHANLLYSNWLNYFVYQTTPYDITSISALGETKGK